MENIMLFLDISQERFTSWIGKAKSLYPEGTFVYQMLSNGNEYRGKKILIKDHNLISVDKDGEVLYDAQWRLYVPIHGGKWVSKVESTIKEPSMEELLKEAKRRYPTGCTAMCVNGNLSTPFIVDQQYFKVMTKDESHGTYGTWGIYQSNVGSGVWINLRGKWAEIVSLPKSKDEVPEYVEALNNAPGAFTKGKIYKTKGLHPDYKTHYAIVEDDKGSTANGWDKDKFKPSTKEAYDAQFKTTEDPVEKWKEEVRAKKFTSVEQLAHCIKFSTTTPLEIFDKLTGTGHAAKAENLRDLLYIEDKAQPGDLVGRYIKALKNNPSGGDSVKKADYGEIKLLESNNKYYVVDFPNRRAYCVPVGFYSSDYELMPEGFSPDKVRVQESMDLLSAEFTGSTKGISQDKSHSEYPKTPQESYKKKPVIILSDDEEDSPIKVVSRKCSPVIISE